MFRKFIILVFASILFASCSNAESKFSFISGIGEIDFESPFYSEDDIIPIEGLPSDDDIKKYDEIMEKLQDYSKTEEEIMRTIAPDYGMTVGEMKQFLNDIMPYATGFTNLDNPNEPDNKELIECINLALNNIIVDGEVQISDKETDWKIDKTNLRFVMTTENISINKKNHKLIIKIEFDGSYYKSFKIFQIKLDDKNIDL